MAATETEKPWDFSSVYSLLNSLLTPDDPPSSTDSAGKATQRVARDSGTKPAISNASPRPLSTGLGDFSQIWQYLGTTPEASPQREPQHSSPISPKLQQRVPEKIEYTSDGAAYNTPALAKKLQWRDELQEGTLTDFAPNHSDGPEAKLSKKQRQKRNRAARRRLAEDTPRAASDMESEAEMPMPSKNPAARASVHSLPVKRSPKNHEPRGLNEDGKAVTSDSSPEMKRRTPPSLRENVVAVPSSSNTSIPHPESKHDRSTLDSVAESGRKFLARYNSEPPETRKEEPQPERVVKKEWPVSKPYNPKARSLLPASVRPGRQSEPPQDVVAARPPPPQEDGARNVQQDEPLKVIDQQPIPHTNSKQVITPKIIRSGEDRHWAFLLKLISNFYTDRGSLIRPANLTTHSSDPRGIHVFVDASNIFIGFHDQLKRSRGIRQSAYVPRVDMSFDALALLLERRRPVAKRVLAGSTPLVPAFEVAKNVGYECSILDKVYKARELTERQRYFMEQDALIARKSRARRQRNGYGTSGDQSEGYTSGGSADSMDEGKIEVPTHAKEKFVEQGVDEILHLKILESIVDAGEENPPTTIVLATGDAAQAEYSGGFMRMVERALEKGWSVELVSWSANISGMYKRREFRGRWGERFKIVELDDYAEELLDM